MSLRNIMLFSITARGVIIYTTNYLYIIILYARRPTDLNPRPRNKTHCIPCAVLPLAPPPPPVPFRK